MADEILVHISAPTTRQNDELYQSLASAYLDFKPCKSYRDNLSAEPSEQHQPHDATLNCDATPITSRIDTSVATSVSSAGKDSYGSFPSNVSFGAHVEGQEYLSSRPYHVSPDNGSTPAMSRLARLDRSYLHWRDKTTPKDGAANEKKRARQMPPDSDDADTAFIEDSQLAAQVLQSQLPDGYSTTDEDTSDGEAERVEDTPREGVERVEETARLSFDGNVSDQVEVDTTIIELQSPIRADHAGEEAGFDGECLDHEESSPTYDMLDYPTYDTLDFSFLQHGNNDDKSIQAIDAAVSSVDFNKLPVDAFGPEPKISVSRPSTLPSQITTSLSALKTQNPSRFQPLKQRRIPEHDERGHWVVDCAKWTQKLQQEFWSSLHEHVHSGRTGWGTTLHRDARSRGMLGLVKLYCWGEVVEHMWLLLWLCSQGEVSGSRTRWVDANGVAVFEVA